MNVNLDRYIIALTEKNRIIVRLGYTKKNKRLLLTILTYI